MVGGITLGRQGWQCLPACAPAATIPATCSACLCMHFPSAVPPPDHPVTPLPCPSIVTDMMYKCDGDPKLVPEVAATAS